MKITKLGHCCLVIEENGLRILTDPGAWTTAQNDVRDLDVILITHEHPDHLHIESIKTIVKNNPGAQILTNRGVGKLLDTERIGYTVLEHGQHTIIRNVRIEGHGEKHAQIYSTVPSVVNTGCFIADRFFYPGDAFFNPDKPIEILALPVAGPWMKISEAIDYAKIIRPRICFPVHDGMLKIIGPFHMLPDKILDPVGIKFTVLEERKETDL